MNQLEIKRHFNRAKIIESLRELIQNKRRNNSRNFYAEAVQLLQIRTEADRILREMYG
jgi:hypothetical protein